MDLLVSGEWLGTGEILGRAVVYANNGGTFAPLGDPLPAPIAGNAGGAFTWFDVDGDGDLDYFVAGGYYVVNGNGLIEARTQLFRNDAPHVNAAPTVPTTLLATPVASNAMTLSWHAATDDLTPQVALTYELEVAPAGAPAAIERALPEPGGVRRSTAWTLHGLPSGTYRWSVRAKDSAFNSSAVAQGSFSVGAVDVLDPNGRRRAFEVSAAHPNPFHPATSFTLTVDHTQRVVVGVYDVQGRRVALLHEGMLGQGLHAFTLDGTRLVSGTYFIRATGEGKKSVRRVTLLR